ncbi:hypothetical protein [Candidatus Symbiopectobacterium sp. NZEC135]|uniref:hypothetical protein n=1 Tax=Candidatus Symbiopectobacterium sp. NZEC135 TaxID=2820471 RepID=UPI002225C429|nr:hypothetical protein [Candidatus Symbiopectobacterium sp. NZEC135]MCW2478119.1 hypothetical protein [Candidatus Symbiopectobacterium sp. NZEC135]
MGYDEIMSMPFLLFQYLMVLDQLIEPSGAYIEQMRHAQTLSAIYLSTGNVKKSDFDKFAPMNFDYIGVLSGKTQEELLQDRKKENYNKIMSLFDIKDNNDGKQ